MPCGGERRRRRAVPKVIDLDPPALRRRTRTWTCRRFATPASRATRIRLDLPRGADVPAEDHALGRVVGQHARPPTLGAIDATVIDAAADPRLEDRLGDSDPEHVAARAA